MLELVQLLHLVLVSNLLLLKLLEFVDFVVFDFVFFDLMIFDSDFDAEIFVFAVVNFHFFVDFVEVVLVEVFAFVLFPLMPESFFQFIVFIILSSEQFLDLKKFQNQVEHCHQHFQKVVVPRLVLNKFGGTLVGIIEVLLEETRGNRRRIEKTR